MIILKKSVIFIVFFALIIALVVGWHIVANGIANKLYSNIENYNFDIDNLESEKMFDFSTSKYFEQKHISEGLIHKDSNGKISILSNIKVLGLYCEYNNKMHCGITKQKGSNTEQSVKTQKYSIGQAIRLNDNTKWHVISDSSEYSNYVTLIRDERLDINGDGFVVDTGSEDDPDRIPFDKSGSKEYSVDSESNIGYYLNNTYKNSITNLDDILEIRLPHKEEIDNLKYAIGFDSSIGLSQKQITEMSEVEEAVLQSIKWMDEYPRPVDKLTNVVITSEQYEKLMPHWLYNSLSGNYLIHPYKGKLYTEIWNGTGIIGAKPTTGKSLKPVITLNKSNILG